MLNIHPVTNNHRYQYKQIYRLLENNRQVDRKKIRRIEGQRDRQKDRQIDRQIERQIDRQIDRQADRQIDRHIDKLI